MGLIIVVVFVAGTLLGMAVIKQKRRLEQQRAREAWLKNLGSPRRRPRKGSLD